MQKKKASFLALVRIRFLKTTLLKVHCVNKVIAAQLNAGQNWTAGVYPLADDEDWKDAVDRANEVQSFEFVVLCDEQTDKASIEAAHDKLFSLASETWALCRWPNCLTGY